MRKRSIFMAAGVISASLLLAVPGVATADPKPSAPQLAPHPVVKSSALAAPFNLSVRHGSVMVADGGLNLIGKLRRNGTIRTIAADQPGASGIAVSPGGRRLAFTTTVSDPATFENSESGLHIWGARGHRLYADTHAFEVKHNPDQKYRYGVRNPSACVSDALGKIGVQASYRGLVDSHAYSVAAVPGGWVVADAAANALFSVTNRGRIRTLAVLPPQPVTLDAAMVAALGLPDCTIGITYRFESVPTDVEVGADGFLYVTTLPGGPETPVLGARGKLWRVNPYTKRVTLIAGGLLGATNVAIGTHGKMYVAELFGGRISKIKNGHRSTLLELPGVVAVETGPDGSLWAATLGNESPPAPGTIVKIINGHAYRPTQSQS